MKSYLYSATYEFDNDKSESIKGDISRPSLASAFRDVAKLLRKSYSGRRPSSIIIVLEVK